MLNHTTAEKFEVTKLRSNSTVKKSCLHGFGGIRKFWDRHIGIHVSSFFLLSSISVKLPVDTVHGINESGEDLHF